MSRSSKKKERDLLYDAILSLEDKEECKRFFRDLCTISELRAMEQRFEVARLLRGGMIYNDILALTGASSATISRVNCSLQYGEGSYDDIIPRVEDKAETAKGNEKL